MKWLGDTPLYQLFLLSGKVGSWPAWKAAPMPLLLIAGTAGLWASRQGQPLAATAGLLLGLLLLLASAADLALFRLLPRRGLSYGPTVPPWLGLAWLRCGLALAAVPLAASWPLQALLGTTALQIGVSGLVAYGTLVEPFRLQVRRLELPSVKLSNPGTPLRIVQLSDLHVERLTRRERALPRLVAGLEPDLIVLTGDYLNTTYHRDPQALSELRTLLAQLHAPGGVFAVWGTPQVDYPEVLRTTLTDLEIALLEDEAREVVLGEHRLWLIGLTCSRDLKLGGARLHDLLARVPQDAYTILLHHTPDLMPEAAALGVDLVLSGHTHGGQWCLPGFGALHTSSRYWKRYEGGYRREGPTHLYVSRGLGMEGFGLPRARFFCAPEVVLISLTGAAEAGC